MYMRLCVCVCVCVLVLDASRCDGELHFRIRASWLIRVYPLPALLPMRCKQVNDMK